MYSVAPFIINPTTFYTWSATNATPASGSGTSASISFNAPGGVITWYASTTIAPGQVCKVKATYTVHCSFIPDPPIDLILNGNNDATVYPNPNTGIMTLAYSIKENAVLEIMDANNKIVARYDVDAKNDKMEIRRDDLVNGVYLFRLIIKDRTVKTGKIVIIR